MPSTTKQTQSQQTTTSEGVPFGSILPTGHFAQNSFFSTNMNQKGSKINAVAGPSRGVGSGMRNNGLQQGSSAQPIERSLGKRKRPESESAGFASERVKLRTEGKVGFGNIHYTPKSSSHGPFGADECSERTAKEIRQPQVYVGQTTRGAVEYELSRSFHASQSVEEPTHIKRATTEERAGSQKQIIPRITQGRSTVLNHVRPSSTAGPVNDVTAKPSQRKEIDTIHERNRADILAANAQKQGTSKGAISAVPRTNTREYTCALCPKLSGMSAWKYTMHLTRVHGPKIFYCANCISKPAQTRRLLAEFTRTDACKAHYFPNKGGKEVRQVCIDAAIGLIREKAPGWDGTVDNFRDSNFAFLFRDLQESINAWMEQQDVDFLSTGAAWVWLGGVIRDIGDGLTGSERLFLMDLGERKGAWKGLGKSVELLFEGKKVNWFS